MLEIPRRTERATAPSRDAPDTAAILQLIEVRRTYRMGGEEVHALDGVTLSVQRGEFMAIMGRSGSGKSTLLNVIGCLDRPTPGQIILDGEDVTRVPKGRLPRIRREKIGFIFQQFNLIPTLTALENVMLPMEYAGIPEPARRARGRLRRSKRSTWPTGCVTDHRSFPVASSSASRSLAPSPHIRPSFSPMNRPARSIPISLRR